MIEHAAEKGAFSWLTTLLIEETRVLSEQDCFLGWYSHEIRVEA